VARLPIDPAVVMERLAPRDGSALVEIAARAETLPAPDGLQLLEAHVALLRSRVEKGDPLPEGFALVSVGRALARLRGQAPSPTPVVALDLPLGRLRLAAAAPIARWMAGAGDVRDAQDGVALAVASGVAGDLFQG
jgi:hypothetical protein